MAGICRRMHELLVRRRFLHHLVHGPGNHHAPQRQIGAGDALGEGDKIGLHAPMAKGKPASGAAEPGNDLVGDQQDVVAIADFAQARKIRGGRHDNPAGPHHRLGDDGRHGIRAFLENGLLEGIGGADSRIVVARPAIGVGRRYLQEVRHQGPEHLVIRRHAGGAHRRHGDAVIGVNAGEDLHLLGFAAQLPVIAGDLEGGLVRFRPGRGEIDRRAAGISQFDQFLR